MFDIGLPELILIALLGLVILGPQRLPVALRAIGLWLGRAQRTYHSVIEQIESEVGMEEVHRQLRREVMEERVKLHQAAQPSSGTLEPELAAREQRAAEARAQVAAKQTAQETAEPGEAQPPIRVRQA